MKITKISLALLSPVFVGLFLGTILFSSEIVLAAGKKKPAPAPVELDGKRVIAIASVENIRIELPDDRIQDFGQDFYASITTNFTNSGRFIVVDPQVQSQTFALSSAASAQGIAPSHDWHASTYPTATIKVHVDAMNFITGSRGTRMFYGFDERMRTPFNDGYGTLKNEFPLREVSFEPNWFDRSFDGRGTAPFDSRAGLDIGEGLSVDILFAWLALKYALYRTELHLRVEVDAPLAGRHDFRDVQVKGKGYFFDVAGGYQGYSGGIRVARGDAMLQALRNALSGSFQAIERSVQGLPLTGKVDAVNYSSGEVLLGTGYQSQIRLGTRYEVLGAPSVVVEVTSQEKKGSVGKVVSGNIKDIRYGMLIRQLTGEKISRSVSALSAYSSSMATAAPLAASEVIALPWKNLPKSTFAAGQVPVISRWTAFLKSIVEGVLLPYRIWRYFMYDQAYHEMADGGEDYVDGDDPSSGASFVKPAKSTLEWARAAREAGWAKQIGLDSQSLEIAQRKKPPVIAVIDSGVDYNHSAVHDMLWLNPSPLGDSRGQKDRYGWDFVSGDGRPFDDHYHGTEVASVAVAVAPGARIMPLKVFNPWGVTTSAAIYGAFAYAVDHGADVILCGWATRQFSNAVEKGVAYAREHGVIVVAAAGDRGDDLSLVEAFPASLSKKYNNVVTVTGVDSQDGLVTRKALYANYDPRTVTLAAPGQDISVADPRNGDSTSTTTGLAAAMVAGALARTIAEEPSDSPRSYTERIDLLKDAADQVAGLENAVEGGRRLRLR